MSNLVPGLVIAQKYKLDRTLATGGMGSVWTAWNAHLGVPVAIKFMEPSLIGSPELVARFKREATAAAQLRSPQVVQIFEHGVDRGMPFIVMELLDGEDLRARLKRLGRLSMRDTTRIVSEVCKALRRAHEMGVIHRDLKPANIFLARNDDDEMVKVLDFGIAKSLAEAASGWMTKTGQIVGTPQYMSPEQVQCSKKIDHRSDLWSLGIIAFAALTGRPPFQSEAVVDMILRIISEPMPSPSSFARDLGPEVDRFFARALAIAPEARFQSAREMADAMSALVTGAPFSDGAARPSSSGSSSSSSSGSNPLELAATGVPAGHRAHEMAGTVYTSLGRTEDSLELAQTPQWKPAQPPPVPPAPAPAPVPPALPAPALAPAHRAASQAPAPVPPAPVPPALTPAHRAETILPPSPPPPLAPAHRAAPPPPSPRAPSPFAQPPAALAPPARAVPPLEPSARPLRALAPPVRAAGPSAPLARPPARGRLSWGAWMAAAAGVIVVVVVLIAVMTS